MLVALDCVVAKKCKMLRDKLQQPTRKSDAVHCKNIWVTSTIISVTSVACVWGMHHEVQGMLPVF